MLLRNLLINVMEDQGERTWWPVVPPMFPDMFCPVCECCFPVCEFLFPPCEVVEPRAHLITLGRDRGFGVGEIIVGRG